MKNTLLIASLLMAGCVSMHESPAQNYRLAGEENPVNITGHIERKDSIVTEATLHVQFNGQEVLSGKLGPQYTGDIAGGIYQGKPVSSTCSSIRKSNGGYDVRCMVFVANERTVTLTF